MTIPRRHGRAVNRVARGATGRTFYHAALIDISAIALSMSRIVFGCGGGDIMKY